jgi:hypothetical protein
MLSQYKSMLIINISDIKTDKYHKTSEILLLHLLILQIKTQ